MSDRRHYEWTYPTRSYRLTEDDQGHYFMSAVDPRDGQGVTVRVVDSELADRVLILSAENAELRKGDMFECACCEQEWGADDISAFCEHCVDKSNNSASAAITRARAEGRVEGMQEQLEASDEASSEIWAQIDDFHQGCEEQGCEVLRMDNAMRRAMKRCLAAAERELAGGERPDSRKDAGDVEVDDLIARRKPKP